MKLYLKNHAERYPVEQLQLQLFAQEPSEFCAEPFTGDGTVSSLSRGKRYLTATAKVTYQGKTGFASNRVLLEKADVRATRRILQRSYYLAALQVLPAAPPWGALSGVRPTKLSTKCLMAGGSERDAERRLRQTYFVSPERARLCVDASRHTVEAAKKLDADDLSVYIGIPFCPTRCAYCSFVSQSIERFGEFLPAYLDALLREIAHTGALLKDSGFHIRTLYMGGGTPTTLSSAQMARLLEAVNRNFDLSRCLEFTVEGGRPDTLDPQKLRVIKDGGATRISINPQTMSDKVLEAVEAGACYNFGISPQTDRTCQRQRQFQPRPRTAESCHTRRKWRSGQQIRHKRKQNQAKPEKIQQHISLSDKKKIFCSKFVHNWMVK